MLLPLRQRDVLLAPPPVASPGSLWLSSALPRGRSLAPHSNFAAAFAQWKNLSRIQRRIWVECIVNSPHEVEIPVAEEQRHQFVFLHADAMFSRQRSAHFHAVTNNFLRSGDGLFKLFRVARIVEHDGVQVPVSRVKNVADAEPVLLADLLNTLQRLR